MAEKVANKAVLVYPKIYAETFWSIKRGFEKYFPRTEFGTPKVTLPPLGLMGLYNYLNQGYYDKIILVDRNIDPRPLESLVEDANHVYIGGMMAQEQGLIEDAKFVKELGKVLIVGGTAVSKDSPLINIADYLVENEVEMVIHDVIEGLRQERHTKEGTLFYEGTYTSPEMFFIPDYSSINLDNYVNMIIQTSRGCPQRCEFCGIPRRFGRVPRLTPIEHIEKALQQLYDLGSRKTIFFADDNFLGNPKRNIELLKEIDKIENRLGYHFQKYTQLTMSISDESEIMEEVRYWLRKTKFTTQFIGVETNNPESSRQTRKHQNLKGERTLEQKLRYITQKTGASVMMGIIYGFDNDTLESADSLINFINSTHSPLVMASLLIAETYADLRDRLKEEGRLRENSSGNNSDGIMNFIPYHFSAEQAEKNYIKILEGIYSPDAFFKRVLEELELINPLKETEKNSLSLKENLLSAFRILTKENALIYWKNLPKAHNIARKRFGFMSPEYKYLMAEFFTHCFRYTHFKGQVESLKDQQRERKYEPWQKLSFREIQEKGIDIKTL
ncbi:MAG: DUF4070 domain-containing protein [archaeon]